MAGKPASHPTPRYRRLAGAIAVLLAAGSLLAALVVRSKDEGPSVIAADEPPTSSTAVPSTTSPSIRNELLDRLREILAIRDRAFRTRNAKLLDDIYTADCPCRVGDKSAINELARNNYRIIGGATSIEARRLERVTDRLWLIIADFRSAPLRIETEGKRLIRVEPAEAICSNSRCQDQPLQVSGCSVGLLRTRIRA
jgi:hypothetical protein